MVALSTNDDRQRWAIRLRLGDSFECIQHLRKLFLQHSIELALSVQVSGDINIETKAYLTSDTPSL
jgi:hypothetical protein